MFELTLTKNVSYIQEDDIGIVLTGTIKKNGSAFPLGDKVVKLVIVQPDETVLEVTATVIGDGTAGQFKYTSLAATFPDYGIYRVQAQLHDNDLYYGEDAFLGTSGQVTLYARKRLV